ncbi:MAG: AMP-binding protein, partial [Candidatus Nanopelagicales bacterium]|nr:AMP-binding protein [Candidatus Nanopelagicales bacterium]
MTLSIDTVARATPRFVTALGDFGGRTALIQEDHRLTYAELDRMVRELARSFENATPVRVLSARNTIDGMVEYLAALRAGRVVAMSTPCRVDDLAATYGSAQHVHPALAVLLPTSGSTGDPKTVRLSATSLDANAQAIATALDLTEDDRAVTTLSPAYSYGLSVINSHLAVGAGIVLTQRSVTDPGFFDGLDPVTVMPGVPYTFEMLRRLGFSAPRDLPSLRLLTCAGGRLPAERVREFAAAGQRDGYGLAVMYGQTEATARMAVLPPALAAQHPDSVGYAVPGGRFEIVDPDDRGVGEIVYHGPNVMMGYAEGPGDLTADPGPARLVTGDQGFMRDDLLHVTGRISRFAKVRGLRMNLDDIERCLEPWPAVCVELPEQIGVVCELAPEQVAERVAAFTGLGVAAVHAVAAEPPRLNSGKPDRAAALAMLQAVSAAVDAGTREQQLCDAYGRLLGCRARPHDSFRGLGGDSMSFVAVSIEVERILGELPLDWHLQPIAELATTSREAGGLRRMETSVVLRAVSISLVVAGHAAVVDVRGGAHLLVALLGYNFARFQAGAGLTVVLRSLAWLLAPALVWVGVVAAVAQDYSISAMGLSWITQPTVDGPDWRYWFIGALVWVLPLAALFATLPALRRLRERWPVGTPATAMVASLLVAVAVVPDARPSSLFSPWAVLWVFFLGWSIAHARGGRQRAALSAAAVVLSL